MSVPNAISYVELRSFAQLDELSDSSLEAISEVLLPMYFEKGTTFHRMGNQENHLFFIKVGKVAVHTLIEDEEELITELHQFQIFGHRSLFRQSSKNISYSTLEDTLLYALPSQLHQWALERGTPWAIEMQKSLVIQVVHRMRDSLVHIKQHVGQEKSTRKELFGLLHQTNFSLPTDNEDEDSI